MLVALTVQGMNDGKGDDNGYRQMMKRLLCFSRLCKLFTEWVSVSLCFSVDDVPDRVH